jgi:O-antigen/teichoic acid export membrane protein
VRVRKLLTNVFSSYATAIVAGLTGLILVPLLFRYLHPTAYGVLAFALAASASLEAIDLGMTNSLIRGVSVFATQGRIQELHELVSSAFFLLLGIGLTATALLAAFSPLVARSFHLYVGASGEAPLVLALVGLCVSIQLPSTALAAHLMGCHDFLPRNVAEMIGTLFRLVMITLLVITAHGLIAIALVYPLASLVRFIALLVAVRKSSIPTVPRSSLINIQRLREISGFASLSFIEDLATRYYFLADSLLAAWFLPLSDLAILTVCRRPPGAMTNLAQQPLWVAYPLVSSAWSRGDQKALQRYMSASTRTLLTYVLPLSAAMFVWAVPILRFWIGPSILPGIPVFRALIVFGVFASIESGPLTFLYGVGRIGFSTALVLILLATLVLVGCWVVPQWHLFGLAVLFTSLYGVGTVLLFIKAIRLSGLRIHRYIREDVLPVLISSAGLAGWFCGGYILFGPTLTGVVLSSSTGFFLYVACLLIAAPSRGARSLRHRIQYLFIGTDEM